MMKVGDVLNHKHGKPPKKRKWMSAKPTSCQLCGTTLSDKFVDGATRFGPWAIMCPACHRDQKLGLGTGRGQMYDLDTLEKIDG